MPEGGVEPFTPPPWLSEDIRSRICNMNCGIRECPHWCAESPLLSGHDHRCAVHRGTMRRARLALPHSCDSSAGAPCAVGDTALCPCPPRCWGTCKRCRKERCDRPADHEESCWCGCDRPTPPPTPPSDSRLPPSSPHVQRERPHDRVMKKWRALDKWASLVSKYWRALWASQALELPVATERARSILEPRDR